MKKHNNKYEMLLWSIALPGFGQFLNQKFLKGIVIVALEFLVNTGSNLNLAIIYSFYGEIAKAIQVTNYQWVMFYPCLYFFAMWDAWKDAGGGQERFSFLPFVMSAYIVTVGCIYSSRFKIFGVLIGPIWLPILSVIPGLLIGLAMKKILSQIKETSV